MPLTITIITLLKIDGDPNRINHSIPSLKDDPTTRLENTANEEEFEPVLEPGEGEQDGGKCRDGWFFGEGLSDTREVRREVVEIHHVRVYGRVMGRVDLWIAGGKGGKENPSMRFYNSATTWLFITTTGAGEALRRRCRPNSLKSRVSRAMSRPNSACTGFPPPPKPSDL